MASANYVMPRVTLSFVMMSIKNVSLGLRDWMYLRIALNPYRLFGKYDYCTTPSPEHESRYLKS